MNRMIQLAVMIVLLAASHALGSGVFVRSEGDHLDLTDNANLTMTAVNSSWTISCWVKLASLGGGTSDDEDVVFFANNATQFTFVRIPEYSAPADKWIMRYNDATLDYIFDDTTASTNWTHLCLKASHSSGHITVSLYVNGALSEFLYEAYAGSTFDPTAFIIGKYDTGAQGMGGKISQFAKWHRDLTTTEIHKLAGSDGETKTSATDLESPDTFVLFMPMLSDPNDATAGTTVSNTGVTFDTADDPFSDPSYTLTFTGGTGCTAVTPKFTFPSGTVAVYVDAAFVKNLTSGVEDNISLTVGQTLEYRCSNWDVITAIDINGDKVSGDLSSANWPSGLLTMICNGCALLTGDVSSVNWPSGLLDMRCNGCTLLTGDVSSVNWPSGLQRMFCYGCTLLTGDVSSVNWHSQLQYMQCYGCPLLTGDVSSANWPSGLLNMICNSCTLLTGDVSSANWNSQLQYMQCYGCTLLTGDVSSVNWPSGLLDMRCYSCPLLTGDLSGGTSFAGLQYLYAYGTGCTYGTAGHSLQYCDSSLVKIDFDDCGLVYGDVTRALNDLVASGVTGKAVDIGGNNAGPAPGGGMAAATLTAASWTVKVNATTHQWWFQRKNMN